MHSILMSELAWYADSEAIDAILTASLVFRNEIPDYGCTPLNI